MVNETMIGMDKKIFEQAREALPLPLRDFFEVRWRRFQETGKTLPEAEEKILHSIPRVWACSDFVAGMCLRRLDLFNQILSDKELITRSTTGDVKERLRIHLDNPVNESELKQVLRQARNQEMVRIAWRDLAGWSDLDEVMESTTVLAEVCIDFALTWVSREAQARYGEPATGKEGQIPGLLVIAMGKLGGKELNFSSDIDLIFAYPEEGETSGKRAISHQEYFSYIGRQLISILNDVTSDGFVFRVDMRLRPHGNSGPLAISFDAMEHYFQTHGREWERYAWIKARVITGNPDDGKELMNRLRPFVYRRYLDYSAIESIRKMKALIDRELANKGVENNIKLGPGGIREVEFIGQTFQLIRGGRDISLQVSGIRHVLALLRERGEFTSQIEKDLQEAYKFLRNCEHRLQMYADQQTHLLPQDELDQLRIAYGMGFADWPSFEDSLRDHMNRVHAQFELAFSAPQREAGWEGDVDWLALWQGALELEAARRLLSDAGYQDVENTLSLLSGLREGAAYRVLTHGARDSMDALLPMIIRAAGLTAEPNRTLARLFRVLEAIGRRSTYLALLIENSMALSQLVKLCSASSWIATWISRHPIILDELLNPGMLYVSQSHAEMEAELNRRLEKIDDDDLEMQLEILREFRHGSVMRVAATDIGPGLSAGEISRQLCTIAEVVLERCLELSQQSMITRHGYPTFENDKTGGIDFIIVAYGKLGSLELGYTSDLDMIFLYGNYPPGELTNGTRRVVNEAFFARLGQRLIHMLTIRTPTGSLYEVDMRLRPSGQSGPLVTSLQAFERYQHERAWLWEHQALVRARPVAGNKKLCHQFEIVRRKILGLERNPAELCKSVVEMRNKMRSDQKVHNSALFDLKHDPGGIVDIEFMVQYWILRWAHDYPELVEYTDNSQLLEALATAGLLDEDRARVLTEAYRHYLSTEYRLKLMEQGVLVDPKELEAYPEKVKEIWWCTFEK